MSANIHMAANYFSPDPSGEWNYRFIGVTEVCFALTDEGNRNLIKLLSDPLGKRPS